MNESSIFSHFIEVCRLEISQVRLALSSIEFWEAWSTWLSSSCLRGKRGKIEFRRRRSTDCSCDPQLARTQTFDNISFRVSHSGARFHCPVSAEVPIRIAFINNNGPRTPSEGKSLKEAFFSQHVPAGRYIHWIEGASTYCCNTMHRWSQKLPRVSLPLRQEKRAPLRPLSFL